MPSTALERLDSLPYRADAYSMPDHGDGGLGLPRAHESPSTPTRAKEALINQRERPAYGYMRVVDPVSGRRELALLGQQMTAYARGRGLFLRRVLVETPMAQPSAFVRLMERLGQEEVTELIVPSLGHFTRFVSLQTGVLDHLDARGVMVWTVDD